MTTLPATRQVPTTDRGSHELKGVPGAWQLFALADSAELASPPPGEMVVQAG